MKYLYGICKHCDDPIIEPCENKDPPLIWFHGDDNGFGCMCSARDSDGKFCNCSNPEPMEAGK